MRTLPDPPILLITDRHQAEPRSLEWVVTAALEGGAKWVSVREKDLDPEDRLAILRRLLPKTAAHGATLMVHDDLSAACTLNLIGLHLPRDGDAATARKVLPDALIGQSWHGDFNAAERACPFADYLTLSPIFPSRSKPGYGPALGASGLAEACRQISTRIIGLGGVDSTTLAECAGTGAAGVAVMGGIMRAIDPARAFNELLADFRRLYPVRPM